MLKPPRHLNPDLIRAVNPEGEDLLAHAEVARAEWDRARDALLNRIDAVRPKLDWALRQKIRDLLALVADLVLFLPDADRQGEAGIQADIDVLLAQVTALRSRLAGG